MQALRIRRTLIRRTLPAAARERRRQLWLGIGGALAVAALLLAVSVLYAVPVGQTVYTAYLADGQSVRAGDDVRIAGITVGSVRSLELRPRWVEMRFAVDSSVFLGSETTLDIRMLTVVGGHYVAVTPAGSQPLGRMPIPADRVRLPYNLMQVFDDAVAPVREIDGNTLRANLASLADGLQTGPESVRRVLDGVGHFVEVLEQQRADVSKATAIADEYLDAVTTGKSELRRLVEKVDLLETMISDKRDEVREAVRALNRVINRIGALQPAWEGTFKPIAQPLADALHELESIGEKLVAMVNSVHEIGRKLTALIGPDGTVGIDDSGERLVSEVCVPVPGKAC
ncbi:MlaD family protein [Nocardia sp. NPDC004068]|uniref:MlaD family protein n=1 Tax=Nocardia sp. NPDC004068 TaxID=3364303 RepID=UPI00367B8D09